jgi:hypothetical protein
MAVDQYVMWDVFYIPSSTSLTKRRQQLMQGSRAGKPREKTTIFLCINYYVLECEEAE